MTDIKKEIEVNNDPIEMTETKLNAEDSEEQKQEYKKLNKKYDVPIIQDTFILDSFLKGTK